MQALKPWTGMTGLKKYFRRQAFADVSTGHDPIDPARSPGLRPFLVAFVVAGLLGSADAAPQPLDVVRPTAVAIVHTQPRADVCWTSDDEEDREAVADAFVRETAGRQARLGMMQLDLLAVLRPDAADPAKPADLEATERKIREIARITVEQDMALLRAI